MCNYNPKVLQPNKWANEKKKVLESFKNTNVCEDITSSFSVVYFHKQV